MKEQDLGRGHKVIGFESIDELIAYEAQQEADANEHVLDRQREITWGTDVLRVVDQELIIFGHIFTEEEFIATDELDQAPLAEQTAVLRHLRASHDRGYRYGHFYSVVSPEGEYGSAHLVSLWPISQLDFSMAQAAGWVPWKELVLRVRNEVAEAKEDSGGS